MKASIGSAPLTDDPSVKKPGDGVLAIDWSLAVSVSTSGTTCDTFRYEYNNRRIFIKKLKDGMTANVRYLDAIRAHGVTHSDTARIHSLELLTTWQYLSPETVQKIRQWRK